MLVSRSLTRVLSSAAPLKLDANDLRQLLERGSVTCTMSPSSVKQHLAGHPYVVRLDGDGPGHALKPCPFCEGASALGEQRCDSSPVLRRCLAPGCPCLLRSCSPRSPSRSKRLCPSYGPSLRHRNQSLNLACEGGTKGWLKVGSDRPNIQNRLRRALRI